MKESNNFNNFILKNAFNNPNPTKEIVINTDEEEIIEVSNEPEEDFVEETDGSVESIDIEETEEFTGFDDLDNSSNETVEGIKESDGIEEIEDVEQIEIPEEFTNPPLEELENLNDNLDYKRLEDRMTNLSTRFNKTQKLVENFQSTLNSLQDSLPQTLVKEADERITKHLGDHIEENIRSNFGNLKEQLAYTVRMLVAQGGVMNQCITALCNYTSLLIVKNKITEIQLAMLKGKTFNESSKKQLEQKLKEAQKATKSLPLKGILQMANSLGDGSMKQPPINNEVKPK